MRSIYRSTALLLAMLISTGRSYGQDEFPMLEGPYMGQEPPGMIAEPFAPGIISKDGYGGSDLYISFRQKDGSWGPAINMGDKVNSDNWDAYASVTPDGKYILFNRGIDEDNENVDIYWVDAKIIETLRPKS